MKLKSFTTFDIVLMALLAVANGVLTTYLALVNKTLTAIGGPIATSSIVGIYMIYGLLAVYIIRKPGTALFTFLMGATVQMMLGNAYGMASAYVAALSYAVVLETVFYLYRYKKWSYVSMMIAAVAAVPLWFVFASYMFGYIKWGIPILLITLVVRCISGAILCGALTKWIGDSLAKTGLLKNFAIGNEHRNEA